MKKSFLFLSLMLVTIYGFGQGWYPINYQAVVRNGAGALVPNGSTVNFRFSLIDDPSIGGSVRYSETQNVVVNNDHGLVSLAIGYGTPVAGIDLWSARFDEQVPKMLKVEVDPTGGTSFVDMGTTQLKGVPYANHAFSAAKARNGYHTVFQHTTSAANSGGAHITNLTYDGAAATDILIVTHCYNTTHLPRLPYSVYWTGSNWSIYLDRGSGTEVMPLNTKFNVMVIKP